MGSAQCQGECIGDRLPNIALSDHAKDFWVASAAAAPVIALAGLVSIPDAAVAGNMLKRVKSTNSDLVRKVTSEVQLLASPNGWIIIYGFLKLVAQGFVLITALLALLDDSPPIPGIWIIVVEGVGLLFLLVAALLAGQVGAARQLVEEEQTNNAAKQLAQDIAEEFVQSQLASKPAGNGGGRGEEEARGTGRAVIE